MTLELFYGYFNFCIWSKKGIMERDNQLNIINFLMKINMLKIFHIIYASIDFVLLSLLKPRLTLMCNFELRSTSNQYRLISKYIDFGFYGFISKSNVKDKINRDYNNIHTRTLKIPFGLRRSILYLSPLKDFNNIYILSLCDCKWINVQTCKQEFQTRLFLFQVKLFSSFADHVTL